MVVVKVQFHQTKPELQAADDLCYSYRVTAINYASNVLEIMYLMS
jgi:hypothetical protein